MPLDLGRLVETIENYRPREDDMRTVDRIHSVAPVLRLLDVSVSDEIDFNSFTLDLAQQAKAEMMSCVDGENDWEEAEADNVGNAWYELVCGTALTEQIGGLRPAPVDDDFF